MEGHLAQLRRLEAQRCKIMNHPSQILEVESCAISGIECTGGVAGEPEWGYLCHFHHFQGSDGGLYTRIELDCLSSLAYAGDILYQWDAPAPWVLDPTIQCFAVGFSPKILAFATTEAVVGVVNLPWHSQSSVRLYDVSQFYAVRNHGNHHSSDKPTTAFSERSMGCQVSTTCSGHYIWVMYDFGGCLGSMVLIVDTVSSRVYQYDTSAVCTSIQKFLPTTVAQPILAVLPDYFVFVFGYYSDSANSGTRKLQICAVSRVINRLYACPTAAFDSRIAVRLDHTTAGRNASMWVCVVQCAGEPHSSKLQGVLRVLRELGRSFALPFCSPIRTNQSRIPDLSARLSSPWAAPVALIHIALFVLFVPFMLIPVPERYIKITIDRRQSKLHTKLCTKYRFFVSERNTSFHHYLPEDIEVFLDADASEPTKMRLEKYTPTNKSKEVYAQSQRLRKISTVVYMMSLVGFLVALWFVFQLPTAKFDLVTCIALADAGAVYGLSISQDIATAVPLVWSRMRSVWWLMSSVPVVQGRLFVEVMSSFFKKRSKKQ